MTAPHDHFEVPDARAPEVAVVAVTEVKFRRGVGCCEKSPMRIVTAYYRDGVLLVEHDPWTIVEVPA